MGNQQQLLGNQLHQTDIRKLTEFVVS